MLNWEKIKSEVDIEVYFLSKMGSFFTFDKYKRAYVERNSDGSAGDIIRFFRHRDTGVKMYYSISHQDSGDIIQFIKNRILQDSAASYDKINEELRLFLGSAASYEIRTETISKKDNIKTGRKFHANGNIIQKIDAHLDYLINYRKFSPETIHSEPFTNLFFSYITNQNNTLSYYLKDINGEIVGINRIQTVDNQYFNKKWFAPDSNNSIGFAWSREVADTETLSVFESIFDAMAYYEIFQPKQTQFVATNGELSFKKASHIIQYFNAKGFKKIELCNDKDLAGQYFNLNLTGNIIPIFKNITKSEKTIKMDIVSTSRDTKTNLLLKFFKKTDQKPKLNSEESFQQMYYQETLSDSSTKTSLIIATTSDSIQFFVSLLIDIFDLKSIVEIKIPVNKDFNEDLILKKQF